MMKKNGFALLEMLIVLAIMLAVMAMSAELLTAVTRAQNEKQAIGNMQTLIAAENTYYSLYGAYPTSWGTLSSCPPAGLSPSAVKPCLVSSAITSGNAINGYQMGHETVAADGYFFTMVPANKMFGAITYCAINGLLESGSAVSDGLIRGHLTEPAEADCNGADSWVVSNSGQGPAGPPGPANGYQFTANPPAVGLGGTQSATFTVPSGIYALNVNFIYSFGSATPNQETISCAIGSSSTQWGSTFMQHQYSAGDHYGGGVLNLSVLTPANTTSIVASCSNGSPSPFNWNPVLTAIQLTTRN
jgi:prepilin-type N-terminal cleavage/methylation domain-containing protein